MRLLRLALLAMTAAAGFAGAAQAQQCAPLQRALSLDLTPGPAGGPMFGVSVTVNGTPRSFLLATAASVSSLSRKVVTELNLPPRLSGRAYSIAGNVGNAYSVVADLGVSNQVLKGQEMWVAEGAGNFDGFFGPDLMQHYDIEIDFASRKLNYFLTDHCEGKVVYWPSQGYTSTALRGWSDYSNHPTSILVKIDGHEVWATVNTTLNISTLEADTAHQLFDLTADSPGAVPLGTMDGNLSHRTFGYTFKTLSIGGLTFSNPRLQVIPDLIGSKGTETVRADSRLVRYTDHALPTMRLGMDVLRRLHLYFATKEEKLYVTPAQSQPPAPAAAGN